MWRLAQVLWTWASHSRPGGAGNLDADPDFVNVGIGDYTLSACSPAADSGNNCALAAAMDPGDLDGDMDEDEDTPLDLDLNARAVDDPCEEDDSIVDMGCYESPE